MMIQSILSLFSFRSFVFYVCTTLCCTIWFLWSIRSQLLMFLYLQYGTCSLTHHILLSSFVIYTSQFHALVGVPILPLGRSHTNGSRSSVPPQPQRRLVKSSPFSRSQGSLHPFEHVLF